VDSFPLQAAGPVAVLSLFFIRGRAPPSRLLPASCPFLQKGTGSRKQEAGRGKEKNKQQPLLKKARYRQTEGLPPSTLSGWGGVKPPSQNPPPHVYVGVRKGDRTEEGAVGCLSLPLLFRE